MAVFLNIASKINLKFKETQDEFHGFAQRFYQQRRMENILEVLHYIPGLWCGRVCSRRVQRGHDSIFERHYQMRCNRHGHSYSGRKQEIEYCGDKFVYFVCDCGQRVIFDGRSMSMDEFCHAVKKEKQ